MSRVKVTVDGNEAVAHVAYHVSEVAAIYPITPSSPMGESSDQWSSDGRARTSGAPFPRSSRCKAKAGAAGAVHGALQAGALATTFTSSQGLLLMIPNMYKIAGELTPTVIHVAARALAAQALSIFGDHQDVMAVPPDRLRAAVVQLGAGSDGLGADRAGRDAGVAHSLPAFLRRLPHLARSREDRAAQPDDMRAMIDDDLVRAHRERALSPDHPVLRGIGAESRRVLPGPRDGESVLPGLPDDRAERDGQVRASSSAASIELFDYVGAPDAEHVIIIMGSGAEAAQRPSTT